MRGEDAEIREFEMMVYRRNGRKVKSRRQVVKLQLGLAVINMGVLKLWEVL